MNDKARRKQSRDRQTQLLSLKRNRKFLSNKTNDCEFLETCFLSSGVFNLRSKLQAINHKGQSHVRSGGDWKLRFGENENFGFEMSIAWD